MPERRPEKREFRGPADRRPGTRRRPSERPYGDRPPQGRDNPYRNARGPAARGPAMRGPRTRPDAQNEVETGERLQKVLAASGVASRRDCEELITEGRVEINGKVVTQLGTRVDPARDDVRVDGVALAKPKLVYFVVNKPAGVLCTNDDPAGRERVIDLVPSKERLFTIGRLDQFSEGLIVVTNDGELANKLAHPRYEVPKEYLVEVAGHLSAEDIRKLLKGVHLAEGVAKVDKLYIRHRRPGCMILEMVLREGKNREIRRVLARLGHKVMKLKRVAMGPLRLAKMPLGAHRRLTVGEVKKLENYDPRQDSRYSRRGAKPSSEKPEEFDDLDIATESRNAKSDVSKREVVKRDVLRSEKPVASASSKSVSKAAPRRAKREAADLHGHLEGSPPGRILRRPKPVKGAPAGTSGTVLGGEPKFKVKVGGAKVIRPWDKPAKPDDDDLDEV